MNAPADPFVPNEPAQPSPAVDTAEGYDPVELRRRMAVCFSGPELRELSESLGVAGQVGWDRGPSESSRDLIKQFEKYYGLGILVAKLRELRPLVEWPEPVDPAGKTLPAPLPKTTAAAPLVAPALDTIDSVNVPASGSPIQDPMTPRAPIAPTWPGTSKPTTAAPAAPTGIDPRVLIVVAGLTVLAALIAYAAGRASRPPNAAPEAAGSAVPVAPTRPPGPASRAANAFRRSLDRVVRSCDLPTGADRDASILGLALGHCGLQLRTPMSALTAPPLEPILVNDRPPPTTKVKSTKTSKDPAQAVTPPTSKGDVCIAACETDRRSCNDHCGAEPTESSLYDGYMRCRSRCLSATSHCRLACPQ